MDLIKYCLNLKELWARDRRDLLEFRWNRNRAAFDCDTELFDSYAGVWKSYMGEDIDRPITEEEFVSDEEVKKGSRRWRSRTFMPIAKQKTVALSNLINDQVFRGNKVPFQCDIYPGLYANAEQFAELNQRRTMIENKLNEMLQRTNTPKAMKNVSLSGCIYGEGYLRKTIESLEFRRLNESGQVEIEYKDYLSAEFVSVWDIYRDLQFDNIDDGQGICQRTFVSIADVKRWMDEGSDESYWLPDMLKPAIDSLGRVSDNKINTAIDDSLSPRLRDIDEVSAKYEYLEFWVRVPSSLAEAYEKNKNIDTSINVDLDVDEEVEYAYVLCGILGEEIIRYNRSSRGDHPFYRFEMEHDPDSVGGISVIDNVINEQIVLNGMIRCYEDNKKLSANLVFAADDSAFVGDFKDWYPGADLKLEGRRNVNEAIQQLTIRDVGDTLVNGIQMFMQFADMSSNLPREQQGMPSNNPQTAFEIQQRLERSGKYVGQVISNLDDHVIEPFINDCYEWLAADPEFADLGMAFKVNALGFASYESRALRQQALMQLTALMAQNPDWREKMSADYFLGEIAKSLGIPPAQFIKSPEVIAQEKQEMENSPEYQLNMKKIQAEVAKAEAEVFKLEAETENIKADTVAETVESTMNQATKMGSSVPIASEDMPNEILKTTM